MGVIGAFQDGLCTLLNWVFARFLYVGNRGHNSIAVFRVDQKTGTLALVDIQDSHGAFPRHFNFDRTSQFLVVGNHASDNIVGNISCDKTPTRHNQLSL